MTVQIYLTVEKIPFRLVQYAELALQKQTSQIQKHLLYRYTYYSSSCNVHVCDKRQCSVVSLSETIHALDLNIIVQHAVFHSCIKTKQNAVKTGHRDKSGLRYKHIYKYRSHNKKEFLTKNKFVIEIYIDISLHIKTVLTIQLLMIDSLTLSTCLVPVILLPP